MNQNSKDILLCLVFIAIGIFSGAILFVPIFEDNFMGMFMGFVIGVGAWLTMKNRRNI